MKNLKYNIKSPICFPVLWLHQDTNRWDTTERQQGCYSRALLTPVVLLDLEPSFPVAPKGKITGEKGLELWVQEPCCPILLIESIQGWEVTRLHSPTTKGLHSNIPIALVPDTNGFPGSRAQHEATEGPEVPVCLELSGFCSANTHQPPLLTVITYFLKSSGDTKYPKHPPNIKYHRSWCTECLEMVWVGNVSGYTGLLGSVPHPWLSGEQQKKPSETVCMKKNAGIARQTKRSKIPKLLLGFALALRNFTIKQSLSPSHLQFISQEQLIRQTTSVTVASKPMK